MSPRELWWVLAGISCITLLATGCASTGAQTTPPESVKVHYLDDGSTLRVEDPLSQGEPADGLSLLEKMKKLSGELNVSNEKNALLAREISTMRSSQNQLQDELEQIRTQSIGLTEQIAAMNVALSERESKLDQSEREKRDLMEKLINLKIEKAKVEKELLKIKIAALSGEG
ncbi:MAG: hypothetical protein KJ645_12985 [Planctomycetes bacterium]|nr:hypothetical protein [Planctomycetota bacterium]